MPSAQAGGTAGVGRELRRDRPGARRDLARLLRPHVCPAAAFSPYRVTIRVPPDPAAVYLYPIRLCEALPEVRVPLRRDDPPVPLGLQGLIEQAYANGRTPAV